LTFFLPTPWMKRPAAPQQVCKTHALNPTTTWMFTCICKLSSKPVTRSVLLLTKTDLLKSIDIYGQ
jgi:hypothetical protein